MKTCYIDMETRVIADLIEPGVMYPGWLITRINVPADKRGNGLGSAMLQRILRDADQEQVLLYLEPMATGQHANGLDQDALVKWYEAHGFVTQPEGYMIRKPVHSCITKEHEGWCHDE